MKPMIALAGAAFLAVIARSPEPGPPTLYLFFTFDTPDAARAIRDARRAAGDARFRPVFLLDRRFPAEDEPPPGLRDALEAIGGDVAILDPEGLERARAFGVRSTPCAVWTGRGLHRASGTGFPWKELIRCE